MGIEKDIQQGKFRSEQHKAMINIMYTYGWLTEKLKNFLAGKDITLQQYNILRILRGSHPKPMSTLQIRERMLDKMSDTSRIVDRLVVKGFVQKVVCGKDKRLVDVTISENGKHLLQELDSIESFINNMMGGLSKEEAQLLSDLLDKVRIGVVTEKVNGFELNDKV